MTFKVAILQARSENANISKNVDIIHHAMKKASINNADILLLPECFITGYDLPMTYEKSISDDNEVIQNICALAKEYHMGVVLTSFTKGERKPQNTAFVISKQGNILMKYSKVHTCDFADEKEVEEGKEFKVYQKISKLSSASTHACISPSRASLAYSSGLSIARRDINSCVTTCRSFPPDRHRSQAS